MFSFFKSKKPIKDVPSLKVDVHSHLIPGIDDGSRSMEESLSLLQGMKDLGYDKIITTPHIMKDSYCNTPEIIRNGLAELRAAARKKGIDIIIEAAAEYYLDDGFLDHLERGDMMTLEGKYILFETSYFAKPLQLEEMIFEISAAGYIPVMAHPERYRYIKDPEREYSRFLELGVLLQMNLNSLGGHYGKTAKRLAEFLSRSGMISFLGSDVHGKKQIEFLSDMLRSEAYGEIYTNNTILNNTFNTRT
ncbi:MAG TPA: capsular biosynthesis protein [Epsilonproteobacteria bacterium]|nr:capsular biosynthesis protein [Campylobacterota bacterium]